MESNKNPCGEEPIEVDIQKLSPAHAAYIEITDGKLTRVEDTCVSFAVEEAVKTNNPIPALLLIRHLTEKAALNLQIAKHYVRAIEMLAKASSRKEEEPLLSLTKEILEDVDLNFVAFEDLSKMIDRIDNNIYKKKGEFPEFSNKTLVGLQRIINDSISKQ